MTSIKEWQDSGIDGSTDGGIARFEFALVLFCWVLRIPRMAPEHAHERNVAALVLLRFRGVEGAVANTNMIESFHAVIKSSEWIDLNRETTAHFHYVSIDWRINLL